MDEAEQIREEVMQEVFENAPAPEQAAEAPETVAVDPWEGVAPAIKQQFESISGRLSSLDTIETRLKQTEKRIGSVQNEIFNAAKKVEEAPTKEEIESAAKTDKAWSELQEDFPEWATAIESKFAANNAEIAKKLPDVTEIKRNLETMQGNTVDRKLLEKRFVSMQHPRWEQTIETPSYKRWLATQPAEIKRRAAHGETAEEAIDVLNRFKAAAPQLANIANARNKRLEQAVSTTTRHKVKPIKSESNMSEQELREKIANEVWETA